MQERTIQHNLVIYSFMAEIFIRNILVTDKVCKRANLNFFRSNIANFPRNMTCISLQYPTVWPDIAEIPKQHGRCSYQKFINRDVIQPKFTTHGQPIAMTVCLGTSVNSPPGFVELQTISELKQQNETKYALTERKNTQ